MEKMASYFLKEKNFSKKVEKVMYFAKIENLFFDKSTVLKAELARMFIDSMNLEVDQNEVVTAALMYSLKKVDGPIEIEREKQEISEDRNLLKNLGFSDRFSKYATQYIRNNKDEDREKEGDILELIEQFGGMILHRENRLAYNPYEAIDLIKNKNLIGLENRYLEDFILFVDCMENIKLNGGIGVLSKLEKEFNSIEKNDISAAMRIVYDLRDSIVNTMKFNKTELFEDDINYIKLLKKAATKTVELFEFNKDNKIQEDK